MADLKHFGIVGMHWGRRKSTKSGTDSSSSDHKTATILKKKKLSEMSNEELKKLTTRLQLEKQFKDLSKSEQSAGQRFVSDVLLGAGKQLASKYVANSAENGIKILSELFKNK